MWQLLLLPVLIGMNAFFVAAEYALVAIRTSQIEPLRQRGRTTAARALSQLKGDMASAIGAIQVCITMTNLLLGWIGEPALSQVIQRLIEPLGVVIPPAVMGAVSTALGFIVVTLLTVVLSELLPKALTLQHTVFIGRFTAPPMLWIMRLITPLVWIMNGMANLTTRLLGLGPVEIEGRPLSAEEIGIIAREAGEAGSLTPRERSLILNTLALGRRRADEIMVPRVRVSYLDLHRSMQENLEIIEQRLFTRLPLCDGGMDHVIGVIDTKEFFAAYRNEPATDSSVLQLITRRAVFVPAGVSLDRLLTLFREHRTHMLFLVDEFGGVDGIVTMTDVIDELVGEMPGR